MSGYTEKGNVSLLQQALKVNKKPFPWVKAFLAGLAAGLPVIIGILFGELEYGLLTGMGGFTYLYVFNIPYAQRAKKLFFVVIGITLSSFLGTIAAPFPLAVAIIMGIIAAMATFVFGALRFTGPSAIFFVLVFAMTSGMPTEPELAFQRAGFVFLGGALSWVIAMAGWFVNPFGPETDVVKRAYNELIILIKSIGTEQFDEQRYKVMSSLNDVEDILIAGYLPLRRQKRYDRLYVLNDHLNRIFLEVIKNFLNEKTTPPQKLIEQLQVLSNSVDKSRLDIIEIEEDEVRGWHAKYIQLYAIIKRLDWDTEDISSHVKEEIEISKPTVRKALLHSFDKNSIVLLSAMRIGIMTIIAGIIAYQFHFERSFWVPLSCVAVMSGATVVATYHRAIQRGIGTIVGILIASFILSFHPTGLVIAILIFLLTFITELFIVKNYGLAAIFFTPNALMMAETVTPGDFAFTYFAQARIIDVFIGSIIGLLGVLIIGRSSASSRLPHLISKTIRSQAQLMFTMFSNHTKDGHVSERELSKLKTNIQGLKTVYNTAAGEIPIDRSALTYYWPVVFWLEQITYFLEKTAEEKEQQVKLSDEALAQLLYSYESLANAAYREHAPANLSFPKMQGLSNLKNDMIHLQRSLQMHEEKHPS